jgi:spore maturation protein CgeB
MEALASGAMVMTNPMHALPVGFMHTENIIVHSSFWELQHHINYYLQHEGERQHIASAGHQNWPC